MITATTEIKNSRGCPSTGSSGGDRIPGHNQSNQKAVTTLPTDDRMNGVRSPTFYLCMQEGAE